MSRLIEGPAVRVRPSFETILFSAVAIVALLSFALQLPSPPLPVQAAVLGVLVATLGVPHGALDPLIARRTGLWRSPLGFAGFNLGYIGIVALVVGVWLVAPVASLIGFLVISGIHFGADWNVGRSVVVRSLTGIGLLTLPAFSHYDMVAGIYQTLAGDGGIVVADVQAWLGPIALGAMLLGALLALRRRPTDSLEIVLAGALALVAPPLVFFALYFCALHSARHLRHGFAEERGSGRIAVTIMVIYTVVPIIAVAILTALFAGDFAPGGSLSSDWIIRLVFIGLAALTVPHMSVITVAAIRARRARPKIL
ncbi:Brp/Blh family beta-carotene 15,15'-dioxygenase [Cryobacterium sp. CG_9.6]|uniref:Brp/Blh family beta-carotene 15,15'-dioxygenase n=1 Tax=Cryobacterium sp. CG_9.6 TaxID=2760710 RepID=UPI00247411CC|nr:Brp/Blh family beta-carotene 15,15'-dioxygenase [Cryobacterium sp. CG_9.6]MDH6237544.1 Brp/Blh family beta-carotene 15,15'-monooxygenase [Cryobacterium sp. CG_9.6]